MELWSRYFSTEVFWCSLSVMEAIEQHSPIGHTSPNVHVTAPVLLTQVPPPKLSPHLLPSGWVGGRGLVFVVQDRQESGGSGGGGVGVS